MLQKNLFEFFALTDKYSPTLRNFDTSPLIALLSSEPSLSVFRLLPVRHILLASKQDYVFLDNTLVFKNNPGSKK